MTVISGGYKCNACVDPYDSFTCWGCMADYIDRAGAPDSIAAFMTTNGDLACMGCRGAVMRRAVSSNREVLAKFEGLRIEFAINTRGSVVRGFGNPFIEILFCELTRF